MAFGTPKLIDVKYDAETVQDMLSLLKAAPFPERAPIDADTPWKLGIEYDYLKKLRETFLTQWSWKSLERRTAKFDNYLVHYENEGDVLDLHFVHAKSSRPDAIPLILLHGWPGTFFDFHKVIEPLTSPPSSGLPAFHVVVPSLPGYFLSTLPRRDGWSLADTARVFDDLMTSVLGYTKYVGQDSVSLMHFNMFRTSPMPNRKPSTFSEVEKRLVARRDEFATTGRGYKQLQVQATKVKTLSHFILLCFFEAQSYVLPFTIGIAIASSPLALLAYIGEKMYGWSDPERLDIQDVLDTVALYFLSNCFPSSVIIYNQAKEHDELVAEAKGNKWLLKNKFGFSAFPYEISASPRCDMGLYGPLHANGGHFPALDSPIEFVDDMREFVGEHWMRT
ncbi:alpha/beta-hydrolase [Fomitiporia mediterranea MF3/22]|uniref:alpha/beta-hydrolase n=1 Tax=Fomitiporia mediterranea (strain MF3/22) TaxID=694068 RepID=UPI0004408154|nr:alpha/beta-hydrolase [Fomitiporia mediterranea MF3/22]EJD06708.1 alpha/beta-hydrolase [Fomitiporia mediterranea MF3/22]